MHFPVGAGSAHQLGAPRSVLLAALSLKIPQKTMCIPSLRDFFPANDWVRKATVSFLSTVQATPQPSARSGCANTYLMPETREVFCLFPRTFTPPAASTYRQANNHETLRLLQSQLYAAFQPQPFGCRRSRSTYALPQLDPLPLQQPSF